MEKHDDRNAPGEGDPPATNLGETTGGARPQVTGREGDTIVQDSITTGRPLEGKDEDPVDRRAP